MMPQKRKSASKISDASSDGVKAENTRGNVIKFGDVQDALQSFSGDGNCSVVKWINDFEEMALLSSWSDLHKFIYYKRLILVTAQAFVRSENGLNSWAVLRDQLLN